MFLTSRFFQSVIRASSYLSLDTSAWHFFNKKFDIFIHITLRWIRPISLRSYDTYRIMFGKRNRSFLFRELRILVKEKDEDGPQKEKRREDAICHSYSHRRTPSSSSAFTRKRYRRGKSTSSGRGKWEEEETFVCVLATQNQKRRNINANPHDSVRWNRC